MSSLKRTREGDDLRDIRASFQRVKEKTALRRSGPYFLERIIFPRLLQPNSRLGGGFPDPTRLCCEKGTGSFQRHGTLALPQRIEASAWLRRFRLLRLHDFRRVVPQDQVTGTLSSITDIVFDMQEQFAVACQARCLSVYSTERWLESCEMCEEPNDASPLVRVKGREWHGFRSGFSAVQFLSSSLQLVAGYHRAPVVDIFDLEEVDEETCEPQQRFSLTEDHVDVHGTRGGGNSSSRASVGTNTESIYANDVVAVTEHVSLAALSSGRTVWLDRRSGTAITCTGAFSRVYNIGQRGSLFALHDPLTAVAFLCRDNPINILCGSMSGSVQLWDVRCVRECVAMHQAPSTICRLQPSYASSLRSVVWLNNQAGDVQGINVGHSDICLIAEARCADFIQTTAAFDSPSLRISVLDPPGLIAFPYASSNLLVLFDVSALMKPSLSPTARHMPAIHDEMDDDDDDDDGQHAPFSSFSHGIEERHMISPSSSLHGGAVYQIPCNNLIKFGQSSTISACGIWTKCGRIVSGDAMGSVWLA
ncbi:hypothetical protein TcG_03173 [Trypanosoma cruzi]|nr:hypothetical protein TcG_03173 [Trypanosoma cruzi]